MAIYHLHDQAVSRSQGRSPVAMAAYRAAERLVEAVADHEAGVVREVVHDYRRKGHVIYRSVMTPHDAPEWMQDRNHLWNGVCHGEKRKDAVYLHEMDVAIPVELSQEEAIALVRDFVDRVCVQRGMVADVAVHWDEGNPHAHIMQTTRVIDGEGFGSKNRDWHRKAGLQFKRQMWAECSNVHLERAGHEVRIDARSYREQGIELLPTLHEGGAARGLMERGIASWIGMENQAIAQENARRIQDSPLRVIQKVAKGRRVFSEADVAQEVFKRVQGEQEAYHRVMAQVMAHPALRRVNRPGEEGGALLYRYTPPVFPNKPVAADLEAEIQQALPLLRVYAQCHQAVQAMRQQDKAYRYHRQDVAGWEASRRQCEGWIEGDKTMLQAEAGRWFADGQQMAGWIAGEGVAPLVSMYHALPQCRLKGWHRLWRWCGQKKRQDAARSAFSGRLKTYLDRLQEKTALDRRLQEAAGQTARYQSRLPEREQQQMQLQALRTHHQQLCARFRPFGTQTLKAVLRRAREGGIETHGRSAPQLEM